MALKYSTLAAFKLKALRLFIYEIGNLFTKLSALIIVTYYKKKLFLNNIFYSIKVDTICKSEH